MQRRCRHVVRRRPAAVRLAAPAPIAGAALFAADLVHELGRRRRRSLLGQLPDLVSSRPDRAASGRRDRTRPRRHRPPSRARAYRRPGSPRTSSAFRPARGRPGGGNERRQRNRGVRDRRASRRCRPVGGREVARALHRCEYAGAPDRTRRAAPHRHPHHAPVTAAIGAAQLLREGVGRDLDGQPWRPRHRGRWRSPGRRATPASSATGQVVVTSTVRGSRGSGSAGIRGIAGALARQGERKGRLSSLALRVRAVGCRCVRRDTLSHTQ
jgi:hypothetical protein